MVASELVIAEAGAGDPDAARARLDALESIPLIGFTSEAETLARNLLDAGAVPRRAAADAAMRAGIERVCRVAGFEPPVICTPSELLETDHAEDPG